MKQSAGALYQQAERLMARGQHTEARDAWRRLLQLEPGHPVAWLRLSSLATLDGRPRDAAAAALQAIAAAPADPLLLVDIGERLRATGQSRAARACLQATSRTSAPGPALFELALLAQRLDLPEPALALAQAARASGLGDAQLRYLLGTLLMFCGRIDDAERELEACLAMAPGLAGAHWTLSGLRRWSAGHNHVARLRQALVSAQPPSTPYLLFALFKELDDCGRTAEAWQALAAGCTAKRRQVVYDAAAETARFKRISEVFTPQLLDAQAPPQEGPAPIFILGQPRTGTTLVEQVLAGHDQVGAAGELHDLPWQLLLAFDRIAQDVPSMDMLADAAAVDVAALGRGYLAQTQWRAGGRVRYTDKLPRNFANIGFIHRALPSARIVHVVRDPMDACFSSLKVLFGTQYPHSYDLGELAAHHAHYAALMRHWHAVLPGRILDVSYEALVARPETVAREIVAFCGLPWEDGCLPGGDRAFAVSTASTVQVREPIHARNVGAWRRYAEPLAPLRRALDANGA